MLRNNLQSVKIQTPVQFLTAIQNEMEKKLHRLVEEEEVTTEIRDAAARVNDKVGTKDSCFVASIAQETQNLLCEEIITTRNLVMALSRCIVAEAIVSNDKQTDEIKLAEAHECH